MDERDDLSALRERLGAVSDPFTLLVRLFAHSPVGFQIYDASGHCVVVNDAFLELFGTAPPAEYNVLRDENAARDGYLDLIHRAFAGETIRIGPTWYDTGDLRQVKIDAPRRVAVEATMFPLRDAGGAIRHVVIAFEDLTSEIAAREKAEEERAFAETLLEQAPIGFRVVDHDLRYVRVNRTLARMSGQPVEALIGRTIEEVIPGVDPALREASERVLRTGETMVQELGGTADQRGGLRWWRVHHYPVRRGDRIAGAAAIVEDITAARESAAELTRLHALEREARAEAEAANRSKDEFLATVSHELRTPLGSILGWARMLSSGILDEPKRAVAIETIERSARLQAQLIEDLLDLARIQSGTLRLDRTPLALSTLIEAAIEAARPAAVAKGVALVAQLPHEARAAIVEADAGRLEQVAGNLLGNAIKFTPRGGEIRVTLAIEGSSAVLSIRDDGQGIEPELLPHVFDRFRRGQQRGGGASGLGIGLGVARRLVELHGGTLTAKSEGRGRGAELVVRLPCIELPDDRRTQTGSGAEHGRALHGDLGRPPIAPTLAGVRVLVVDDEPDAREVVAQSLAIRGAEVRVAGCAESALALLSEWPAEVLVSDLGMPRASGHDLIRTVRSRQSDRPAIAAIAVTAFARAEERRAALESGFDHHVSKPFEPDALATLVSTLVAARR
jgi:PAS domain S-box-containing protein